ncbi:hypothetical protein ACFQ1B_37125 [Streptomyces mexicanus]|jgi:hypothetical protein
MGIGLPAPQVRKRRPRKPRAGTAARVTASNGNCRSLGFRCVTELDVTFADRVLLSDNWTIDAHTGL